MRTILNMIRRTKRVKLDRNGKATRYARGHGAR